MNNEIDKKDKNINAEGEGRKTPSKSTRTSTKNKKKRRKKHYTLKFLILVAVCVAVYFFLHSSVFSVEKITLEENQRMTLKQVQQVTGLKKGINLFEFDASDCEAELERDPYISEADVSRKLPDTIEIKLTVREKKAVIEYGKRYILIDKEGTVLEIVKKQPKYTILSGLTVTESAEGKPVQVKETKKYQQYMELLSEMEKSDLYFKRFEIKKNNVTAYAKDKLYCTGSMDNLLAGMQDGNLKAVLWDLMKREVTKGVITIGDNQYYSFQSKLSKSKK